MQQKLVLNCNMFLEYQSKAMQVSMLKLVITIWHLIYLG